MAKDKHKDQNNDDIVLKPDMKITFGQKASLKRSEETGIPLEDEMVIALMEGDVSKSNVDTELATFYASTVSHPDRNIKYPDPASLKKSILSIPRAVSYAAAAIILLLVSIGAWFTFSPASSPDRVQFTLATVNTKTPVLEMNTTSTIQYYNKAGTTMIPAREEYDLSAVSKKNSNPLQVQYALSISDKMSDISLSNTQHPTHFPSGDEEANTLDYAQAEPKKRSLVGKVFSGMLERVKEPFVRNEAQAKPEPEKKFSIWDIAELGVKSVNTLGDHDYTLVRDYNEKGKVKGIVILDE